MLQVSDQLAGKQVKCTCGTVLQVPGAGAVAVPAKAATAPGAPQKQPAPAQQPSNPNPASTMSGLGHAEMSSLFNELTASDMVVKGPSTHAKKVKTKDPLAAYGGGGTPPGKVKTASSSKPSRGSKGSKKTALICFGIAVLLACLAIFTNFFVRVPVFEGTGDATSQSAQKIGFVAGYWFGTLIPAMLAATVGLVFLLRKPRN